MNEADSWKYIWAFMFTGYPLLIVAAFVVGGQISDALSADALAAETSCLAALAKSGATGDALATGTNACLGVEPRTVESCMHDAAKSFLKHDDAERLTREVDGCS